MLYDEFNSYKNFAGADVFKNKATEKTDILKNLNPAFSMREYQKEALGRFYYYCEEYHQKLKPVHLMFNMATGSGKTLIMASNILYFYQKGYRNFIFFTRLGNIIQKTKANFLDPNSKKYLFADKITLGGQEIKIKEVDNFEGVNDEDINIIFSTTALLHSRFNFARENVLTYEDFADKKIVLIADEAHNLSAETNNKISKTEEEDRRNWENTVVRILNANSQKDNVLLEFTATARLEQEYPDILEKYKDKAIYRYDLKEYRLDGFSKDVRTLQINAPIMERALSAVIISQYRRKVAEKYKIALKPVVMFKANRVSIPKEGISKEHNPQIVVSSIFKYSFHKLIFELGEKHLRQQTLIKNATLQKAFQFFNEQKISVVDLVKEIKRDFAPEKCLTVDEDKDLEQKQILLNSLEDQNNEIRAIFATEKLNEGWDVLNLFDIVRLYNSRDAKRNKPGKTTVQEAQLIGRGARYYPFTLGEFTGAYRRKFDTDIQNELRILEQLYYHSVTNPRYIQELESVLVREGIMPSRTVQKEIKIKSDFKNSDFWKNGYIFLNSRKENLGKDVFALSDAKAEFDHNAEINIFQLPTRESIEKDLFVAGVGVGVKVKIEIRNYKIADFGLHIVRTALAKIPAGRFDELKKIFGNIESVKDFISNEKYLGGIKIKVKGTSEQVENLSQIEKLSIAGFVIDKVLEIAGKEKKEYYGTKEFKAHLIRKIFESDKILQLDSESPRAQNMREFDFSTRDWFAQNEIWGTSEEESFLRFIDETITKLKRKYQDIALLRNEQFFKIYSFENGEPFYPDFVLFLTEKKTKQEVMYQIFVEPKGDGSLDEDSQFEKSKEGWKQEFLLEIERDNGLDLDIFKIENKEFRLIGLPFFNEGQVNIALREKFEEVFMAQLLPA
ncbi:MAG: type III deoxyribonuclease [Candidatus Vogelbacteria bacterium CG10_big_fil_rev_8_21_14_0_10_45_14]|uniref:Type III deoxyribonuclease n=1 Tax=Candidatus Vogelbacteria bacterium CG10_big_fil_rev_8_21_14_0_10_45_14 TaxID=1975042 RepID=A0A2H0RKB8_9BACT|nr:MAG: type III deoxyribonuclease [Candidatus Vogelbacteria bacterium CG10_big_fil_rev_8_21_14_0_10_45_14]